MEYEFDEVVERRGTGSAKWDLAERRYASSGILPLWVADMDFRSPPTVLAALRERVDHGIFGYPLGTRDFTGVVAAWLGVRHGWEVDPEWIVTVPGVLSAMSAAVEEFSSPGDGIIIQPPVYPPFRSLAETAGRRVLENPLRLENGRYTIDNGGLDGLCGGGAEMLLFCSPHNPVGRVWSREEISGVVSICREHGTLLVSDDIHCDLVLGKAPHIPVSSFDPDLRCIILVAPTKSFNLAGLSVAAAVVSDRGTRERLKRRLELRHATLPNILSITAAEAAYRTGAGWLDAVLGYIRENGAYLRTRLSRELPAVTLSPIEGTYLGWMDFSRTGYDDAEIKRKLIEEARVWLNHGPDFGAGGAGHQRINLACPRSILDEALTRIIGAFG